MAWESPDNKEREQESKRPTAVAEEEGKSDPGPGDDAEFVSSCKDQAILQQRPKN